MEDFKAGKYNVIVATCVAEEGIDIGVSLCPLLPSPTSPPPHPFHKSSCNYVSIVWIAVVLV
jgi:hypothetical protein